MRIEDGRAFLIDDATRARLIREDAGSADILHRFLRGANIDRWAPEWDGEWMIFARRGIDIARYPAGRRHLEGFRTQLARDAKVLDLGCCTFRFDQSPARNPGRRAVTTRGKARTSSA